MYHEAPLRDVVVLASVNILIPFLFLFLIVKTNNINDIKMK